MPFDFQVFQNPESPHIWGYYSEITLNRFSESESLEFLKVELQVSGG
ncbi:MAG: hypothetical protein QW688_07655 [Thermoprotei archaeon]